MTTPPRPARLALSFALALTAPAALAQTTVLNCGQLFDSRTGKVLGPHTIHVDEGKITKVSAGLAESASDGALIDLTSQTCLPGWADLHIHLDSESSEKSYSEGFRLDPVDYAYRSIGYAEKTLMAGFTTVRDLGGDANLSLHLRDAINQGLVIGPRIFAAGTMVVTTGGVLSYARSGDAPLFTFDEIKSVVDTAKDYGFTVAAHAHGAEGMKRAVLAGVTSIEHGTHMTPEIMQLMRERGTWFVPTIYAGKFVEGKAKIPGYFPEIVRPKAAAIGPKMQKTAGDAYRAGVKIAFGTDQAVGPHGDNAREFLYMVEAGIPAAYSLQAATIHAASVLGLDDMGVIEAGKRADIIAVPGNPVDDINVVLDVRFVMKEGRVYKQ